MQRALTRAFGTALLWLVLFMPRLGYAADPRPLVRVVPVMSGEAPQWFVGFVKHLERELGLRGIDVAIARTERERGRGATSARAARTRRCRTLVEAPSRAPRLSFSFLAAREGATRRGAFGVPLEGVPPDCARWHSRGGRELMRSMAPRPSPREAPARRRIGEAEVKRGRPEGGLRGSTGVGNDDGSAAHDGARATVVVDVEAHADQDFDPPIAGGHRGTNACDGRRAGLAKCSGASRSAIGLAARARLSRGQTQVGPYMPGCAHRATLEVEVRCGWRYMLRHQARRVSTASAGCRRILRVIVRGCAAPCVRRTSALSRR